MALIILTSQPKNSSRTPDPDDDWVHAISMLATIEGKWWDFVKDMTSFGLSYEHAQDKDDWRMSTKRAIS